MFMGWSKGGIEGARTPLLWPSKKSGGLLLPPLQKSRSKGFAPTRSGGLYNSDHALQNESKGPKTMNPYIRLFNKYLSQQGRRRGFNSPFDPAVVLLRKLITVHIEAICHMPCNPYLRVTSLSTSGF